jgi:hypothetical protein
MVKSQEKIILIQSYISAYQKISNWDYWNFKIIYTIKSIPNEWRNASVIPVFKKVTEETLKIRETLVFLTPAIRYTLNSSI